MSILFSPLHIKSVSFRNRIVISPMCQYSATDGFANDWHLVHLGSRAVGGAGLIIQEATAVSPEGRISPGDLGIWKDEQVEKLQQITRFLEAQGAVPGIQLAHAGRKASVQPPWNGGRQIPVEEGGWQTVAPSPVPFHPSERAPLELTNEAIEKVISDFKSATIRSGKAGYKVLEIHAAHGYLINQFLAPGANQRTDSWGGSFENRIRLLLQIVETVQTVWPADLPLFVRISATDYSEGGWGLEDSVRLSAILKEKGVDLIDCSSGGVVTGVTMTISPGYQVPFAEKIKKETGILTGAVGLITAPQQAEAILQNGQADLIILARESLRNPNFPLLAAHHLGDDITWPQQYERAKL